MTSVSKWRAIISFGFALSGTFAVWLVLGERSPFREYFLYRVTVPNIVMGMHIIPYLILMIWRPAIYADVISNALIFLQWLLVGYLLARLIVRVDVR